MRRTCLMLPISVAHVRIRDSSERQRSERGKRAGVRCPQPLLAQRGVRHSSLTVRLDTVPHPQLEALDDLSSAVRNAVHDIGVRRHREHRHSDRRERDPRELHGQPVFGAGTGTTASGSIRMPSPLPPHIRSQPGTQHRLRAWHANSGRRAGSHLRLHERLHTELRGEAFNALNHSNWGTPNRFVNTPQLGTITEATLRAANSS